jgi:hypothetical protein
VKTSPAWVVRYRGEDHLFEGNYDPSDLFDDHGNFLKDKFDRIRDGA